MKMFRVRRIGMGKGNRFIDYRTPNNDNYIPILLAVVNRSLLLAFGILSLFGSPLNAQTAPSSQNSKETTEGEKTIDPELASAQVDLITFLQESDAAQGSDDEQPWENVCKRLEIAFPTQSPLWVGRFLSG